MNSSEEGKKVSTNDMLMSRWSDIFTPILFMIKLFYLLHEYFHKKSYGKAQRYDFSAHVNFKLQS